MKKVTLTKRQMRTLFRKVFKSAEKMSYNLYEDKMEKRTRLFIEDDALEYIMRNYTDRAFGEKSKNKKNYNAVFKNSNPPKT